MHNRIRVMLVDDSAVIRGLFDRALSADPSIDIVGSAGSAENALSQLRKTPADVIVLDVEMPGMSGIEALPQLLKLSPLSRIIMSSSLTRRNAEVSIRAMELGASDVIAKPTTRDTGEVGDFYRSLIQKIKALAPQRTAADARAAAMGETPTAAPAKSGYHDNPIQMPTSALRSLGSLMNMQALAIASSTGGPQALLAVFREFKGHKLNVPVFITQHMPPNFTTILADHISKASGLECREASENETVRAGVIYIAPGDYHMTAIKDGTSVKLKLDQNPPENFCRPSADPMLRSLAKIYRDKLLVAVLTGIGTDGARGAGEVVAAGGGVVAQDEASSVVYGMPKAVADAKMVSAVLPLNDIAGFLQKALV